MRGFSILGDLRFALRSLLRSPGFTLIAIVTLGLGIGANTSMFSILNDYMLRPAPYHDRERLDRIYRATRQDDRGGLSPADYLELMPEAGGYGDIAAYIGAEMSVAEPGKPAEMAEGLRVTANLFSVLGAEPKLGRGFRHDEEVFGSHRVLILSHRYWQARFGGDPRVVGRTVRVDGERYEIVGVMPATFSDWRHLSWVDVFRPLGLDARETRDRSGTFVRLVGRRSANVPPAQAAAFVAGFGQRLAAEFPAANADTRWHTVPIDATFIPEGGADVVRMLIGLSGFVLLIACSNLANLLLARTMARSREFAVRSALGASRSQVLRPLLAEALLLAAAGGVCAYFVAHWTFDWFAAASAGDNGVGVDLHFDSHVLAWGLGVSLFTALAFGLVPALFVQRLNLNTTLKSGGRGTTGDRGHQRFRQMLIVAQFALAMVLLAGAGLFVGGLHEINNRRHGWESDQVVTGSVVLPASAYPGDREVAEFDRLAVERIEALPGVASASVSYTMPFFGLAEQRRFLVAGHDTPQPGHEPAAVINGVSPHYFETVGTRLLTGRAFAAADDAASPRVYIINQAMARGLFGDESPLGRRIAQAGGASAEWGEIVGVVADVQSVFADKVTVAYQLYQPIAQEPRRTGEIAVRGGGAVPGVLIDGVRRTLMALDGDVPVRKLQPAATRIARENYQDGVLSSVLSALAVLGLGLASLGVYGVIARATIERTGEFGIRLALGAQVRDITRLVLGSGTRLALVGVALGLLGAAAVARFFSSAFPAMHTNSGPVLGGATLLLIAVAQLACYLPARYASRISPIDTLRTE